MIEIGHPHMRPGWSMQGAIQKQVDLEDWVWWAHEPVPEIPREVLAREIPTQKWEPTPLYVFGINVRILSSLMP